MGYSEYAELECLYEKCEDCPNWTGTECDGVLDVQAE